MQSMFSADKKQHSTKKRRHLFKAFQSIIHQWMKFTRQKLTTRYLKCHLSFSSFYIAGFVGYEQGRSRLSVFGIPSLVRVLKMKQTNSKPLKPYERTVRQNLLRSRRCLTHDPYRASQSMGNCSVSTPNMLHFFSISCFETT